MDLSTLSASKGNLSLSESMHLSERTEIRSQKNLMKNGNLTQWVTILHPKRRWIYTDEAPNVHLFSPIWELLDHCIIYVCASMLVCAWTINWNFIWALSLQAAVQTWHWHQADNICKGYSVKTRVGKSLKSLARSLYHGPWCLHRTYHRKLRQLGMFVQLPASSMHTYMQYIQHSTYMQSYIDEYCMYSTDVLCI